MIGNMPKAYPDELIYSVLARCYVADGYMIYREFAEDVFVNKKEAPSVEFLGGYKKEIIGRLCRSFDAENLVQLICKGTQFPYYTRFYPLERKKQALEAICKGEKVTDLIRIKTQTKERYIRYCPRCVKEDRERYGETYWHRSHQLKGVNCCGKHGVRLKDSSLLLSGKASPNFHSAEIILQSCDLMEETAPNKERLLARYNQELLEAELDIDREITPITVIRNALYTAHFISKRGGTYRLEDIANAMALFYSECPEEAFQNFQISKLMTGKRLQPTDFARMGLFLGIEVKELLCSAQEDFCIAKFDENCLQFLQNGIGVNETARRLGVTSATVRNIRDGKLTADKKTRICQNGGKKKDWEALDKQLLSQVKKIVTIMKEKAGERPVRITKFLVATKLSISSRSFNRLRHCANYVKQFEETQEEFWAREIIWAITKIEKEGSELYYTAVRRLLNVKRKQIAAALPFIADTRIRSIAAEMTED